MKVVTGFLAGFGHGGQPHLVFSGDVSRTSLPPIPLVISRDRTKWLDLQCHFVCLGSIRVHGVAQQNRDDTDEHNISCLVVPLHGTLIGTLHWV